jgi:hypothetical protein
MDVGIEKKISPLIEHQFPAFYRDEGPVFIQFVKAYYEWLEDTDNPLYFARNFLSLRDIDDTLDLFLSHFQKKYLYGIPFDVIANKRLLLKHVLDVYRSKGSIQCYKLLFRLIYNEDCEVYLPGRDILRASDGKWKEIRYVEITETEAAKNFVGKTIIGTSSKVSAVVENYTREPLNGNRVNTLFISNIAPIDGDFEIGEKLVLYNDLFSLNLPTILNGAPSVIGSLDRIEIINGGRQFKPGDLIKIAQKNLYTGDTISQGVDGVVKVTETFGGRGRILFEILSGGSGYTLDSKKIIYNGATDTTGSGATFNLGSYFNTEIVTYNTDVITNLLFKPIDSAQYDLEREPTADRFSVIGDVLTYQTRRFGSISSLAQIRTGSFYTEPLSIFVRSSITSGAMPGKVQFNSACTEITATEYSFNANTDVDGTTETIAIENASDFAVNDFVYYNVAAGNTALTGLTANTKYYISFANSTHIALSETYGGSNVDITASSISETGHYFTGTEFNLYLANNDTIAILSDAANNSTEEFHVIETVANNTFITLYGKPLSNSTSNSVYKVAPEIYPANFDYKDPRLARPDGSVSGRNASIIGAPSFGNNVISNTAAINSGRGYVDGEFVYLYLYGGLTTPEVLNGGAGYANGEQLVFRGGLPQKEATATVITDAFGTIEEISMTYNGAGYTAAPEIFVRTKNGTGAKLQTSVTEYNDLYEITGRVVKKGIGRKPGYWATNDSFLNSDKYIQDSYYFQDFSYQINAALSLNKYKDILYNTFHTAGAELFGQFFLKSEITSIHYNDGPSNADLNTYVQSAVDFDTADSAILTADNDFFTIDMAQSDIKLEENLFAHSEEVDNAYWTAINCTIEANVVEDRDGANTVDQIISDSSNGIHGVYANVSQLSRSSAYQFSVHASANTGNWLALVWNNPNTAVAYFDLANGVVGSSYGTRAPTDLQITEINGGLYRCSMQVTPVVSPSNWYVCIAQDDGQVEFESNGVAINVWGAQLERGSDLLPYTKTINNPLSDRISYPGVVYGVKYIPDNRTNLVLDSEDFDFSLWINTNSQAFGDAITAPDSRFTADKFTEDNTSNSIHRLEPTSNISFTANTTYTYSVYAKQSERNWISIDLHSDNTQSFTDRPIAFFDLANGVVGNTQNANADIIELYDGWYRCWITATANSTSSDNRPGFQIAESDGVEQYDGIGNDGIFIWGAQLEANTQATSYIKTTKGKNYLVYTSQFGNQTAWQTNQVTVVNNTAFAPNDLEIADSIYATDSANQHYIESIPVSIPVFEGNTYTLSVYLKANTETVIQLAAGSNAFGTDVWANFDISANAIGNTGSNNTNTSIESVIDGWYRCSISGVAIANTDDAQLIISFANNDVDVGRLAVVTANASQMFFVYGAQLEKSTEPTSYTDVEGFSTSAGSFEFQPE